MVSSIEQRCVHPVDAFDFVNTLENGSVRLVLTDPPYFNVVSNDWDNQWKSPQEFSAWLSGLFLRLLPKLTPDGSIVFFGAMGKHGSHPLFSIVDTLEANGYTFRDWLTWRKRRGYGKDNAYLYIREEILWFSRDPKDFVFHKPYTNEKRGYSGFNADYPAHSEYKRVGNVIDDINELFKTERVCQKPIPLIQRLVETHSDPGDLVVDPFVGWGTTGVAAMRARRRFLGSEAIVADAQAAEDRIRGAVSVLDILSQ